MGGFTGHPTWEQEREGKSRTPNLNQNIGVLDLEKGPIFKVLVGIFVECFNFHSSQYHLFFSVLKHAGLEY